MRHADMTSGASSEGSAPRQVAAQVVPTFIATDLLEKLIVDRDALAVRKIVTEGRRH